MTAPLEPVLARVVCDCNVLLQAMLSSTGPARAVVDEAKKGRISLFLSAFVIGELQNVAARPQVIKKYGLTLEKVATFVDALKTSSTWIDGVPHVFDFPRDPNDAHYVDLAVATGARLIVSRDDDLLALNDPMTTLGQEFAARFPQIRVLTPPALLAELRARK